MAASDSNSTPVSSIDVELKAYDPTERLLGADDSDNSLDSSSIASDDFHSESIAKTARPSPRRNRLLWIVLTTVIALALLAFGFVLGVSFGLRKSNDGLDNGLGFNSTLGDGGFNSTLGDGGLDDDTHDDTQDDPHDDTHDDTHDGLDDQVDDEVDDGLGPGPTVDLDYSRYKGNYISNGIHEFVGMRYARPPTGDLRWRAPVNPEHTTETQSAKKFRTICLATNHKLGGTVSGEDCLFVNVWSPNVTADAKLPVMVFIQGGGYTLLARPWINGSEIIETSGQNMVLVTFHYRTGLFGFLAGADVKNDGNLNAGLLDQRFVFEWVQRHISKFGGDPNHVVIQGSSAGGGSVALQLAANGGRDDGLFIGAIMESPFLPSQRSISDLEFQYDHVVSSAGCNDAANKIQCLRGKTLEELQGINLSWELPGRTNKPLFYFGPCTDGEFLRDTPYAMYDRGAFVKVPVLIGHCTDEGSVFATNASNTLEFVDFMQDNYPGLTVDSTNAMLEHYPLEDSLPKHASWFPSASRAFGEATFICPANNFLNAFAAANAPSANAANIFSYRYNLRDKGSMDNGLGVKHLFNGPAVFGAKDNPHAPSFTTYNAPIIPIAMKYWISFVRALDPNPYRDSAAPQWLPWGQTRSRMVLQLHDSGSAMEAVSQNETERCDFWHGLSRVIHQ